MKRNMIVTGCTIFCVLCGVCVIAFGSTFVESGELQRITDWKFVKGDIDVADNSVSWTDVTVPHTWNAADGQDGDTYYRGPGWYKTIIKQNQINTDKRTFIRFNAVGTEADVYLNGDEVGSHLGGYTAFCFELTDFLHENQDHELYVRADNSYRPDVAPLSGDFTIFGGIHRPVEIISKNILCISPMDYASPGVYISQKNVNSANAKLGIRVLADNGSTAHANVRIRVAIADVNDKVVAEGYKSAIAGAGTVVPIETEVTINQPHLWHGVEDPYLYTVKVELQHDGDKVDEYNKRVGLRYYSVDPDNGFFLNGQSYQLRGVNCHYDREGKGAALSDDDIFEDYKLINEIGANTLRMAHYPHAWLSYEICDQLGIMAWAEIPLVNQITHDSGFASNARQQLMEMIMQNYNHFSIFAWSLSNEMYHQQTDDPIPLLNELNDVAKNEDPYRLTVLATNHRIEELNNITDLLAYNKYPGWYNMEPDEMDQAMDQYNESGNNRGIAVSEYGAGGSILHQDQLLQRISPGGHWHPEQWQAYLHECHYEDIYNTPGCWGSFVWNMFDFSSDSRDEGAAPGVNDKGLVTHDRKNRKDAFYFYKANWSTGPVLHLTSKRNLVRVDADTIVKVYTNLSEVSLLVNGTDCGSVQPDDHKIAIWNNIELNEGDNEIVVSGSYKGKVFTDKAVWTYDTSEEALEKLLIARGGLVVEGVYSASNAQAGNGPANAFDNDLETRWASDQENVWIACELPSSREVTGIEICWYNGSTRSYSFEVQTSTDSNTWRDVYSGNSRSEGGYEYYPFSNTDESSHVRIICHGHGDSDWSSINEIVIK